MRLNGINIADLDKKFTIESPTYSRNSVTNEQVQSWSTFATVWGKWLVSSSEKIEADQNVAVSDSKILIRYLSGLTETMRVNDNSVYYYIKGIDQTDRNVTQMVRVEKRDNV
jgi:SPP1 family predicted phage head-tail adaptor